MTITQIARHIEAQQRPFYVRQIKGVAGEPKQYDITTVNGFQRRSWTLLDATTAAAIMAVHRGLREDLRPKMDTIPLVQLVAFCWRVAA